MTDASVEARRLTRAADANFRVHAGWVQGRVPGMRVVVVGAVTLIDSGLPCDTFNVICGANFASEDADRVIRRAIAHFADVRRPFSWWVGPADRPGDLPERLAAAGLRASETELAMAAELAPRRFPPAPPGLCIARARTSEALRDFSAINAANWTPPDPDVLAFYERAAPHVLGDDSPLGSTWAAWAASRSRPSSWRSPGEWRVCTTSRHGTASGVGVSGRP